MVLYLIRPEDTGEDIPINVVANQNWGGNQQTVVYESPGTNGGVVLITGRTTNTITLTGKLIAQKTATYPLVYLNNLKNKFLKIKDKGTPVILLAPVDNNDTGRYLITEFTGQVLEGVSTYLPFTMVLTEYRQANLKQTQVNLISLEPAEQFKDLYYSRTQTG